MIKNKKISLLIICVLAFAIAGYYFFKRNDNPNSEGLSHFKVETFKENTGWAYRIYQDTTIVIEQLYLPGIPGTTGFATEELAKKTGQLVQQKLDMGIFPPTVTPQELDSLGIRY